MTRRRYVQMSDGKLVEITGDMPCDLPVDSGALWGDASYRDMRASDGTPIDTRTKHRDYMRQRGLTTIDDFSHTFNASAKDRAKFFSGEDKQRRADILRAIESRR